MKNVKINPSKLLGKITIPPSKSMSHRGIICASLSEGESVIENIIFSKDILATMEGMSALGVNVEKIEKGHFEDNKICIKGCKNCNLINEVVDCNESGSTLRFLIPIALLKEKEVTFSGRGKLAERPLDVFYDIFNKQGIYYKNHDGKLPLTVKGPLKPGCFEVKGNISSQFITALLFVLPLLDGDSKIIITTQLESKGYVDLTLYMLKTFGVQVENKDYKEFLIKGNQKYKPVDYRVEGDFSQAAFWLVAGLIGGEIQCNGLDINSLQGDKAILDIIKAMAGEIKIEEKNIIAKKSDTKGIVIDVSQCPDLVPILAVLGALSQGTTRIINAERLRIKESDRLKAMASELKILGADIEETKDGLIIQGKSMLKGGVVHSWNDHRIAMALAVASIRCTEPVIIEDSNAVSKSYPDFWSDFQLLGGDINECSLGK